MRKLNIPLLVLCAAVFAAPESPAEIKIVNPEGGDYVKKSACPAKDGSNELDPSGVSYLKPAESKGMMKELAGGDTPFPKAEWTFKKGEDLNGTLNVDVYKSKFKAAHFSGAVISLRYSKGRGDPDKLRWVQMIDTDSPLNKAKPPYIDPFPNDDPAGKDLPFYYTRKEIKTRTDGKNAHGKYDLRFYDFSSRRHRPTSSVKWTADLYLSSWDEKTKTVTIHDGIRWGWKAGCAEARKDASSKGKPPKDTSAVPDTAGGGKAVLTGTVVAGEPATFTVVDDMGMRLSGVVVTVNDEDRLSDPNGRVTVDVPEDAPELVTELPDFPDAPGVETPVVSLPDGFEPDLPPIIEGAPGLTKPGRDFPITGGPFDGRATGNSVRLGETELPVLACSPTEIVATTPPDTPPGTAPLTVTTGNGTSEPVEMSCIRFSLEADASRLVQGETTTGRIHVTGTEDSIDIRVTNATPGVIRIEQGDTFELSTSGGSPNTAGFKFTAIGPGEFGINVEIIDEAMEEMRRQVLR